MVSSGFKSFFFYFASDLGRIFRRVWAVKFEIRLRVVGIRRNMTFILIFERF